jgi:hypothetical protein
MFAFYGGRGIRVCAAWRASFEAFLSDVGVAPVGFSIERIDNDSDYAPGNVRWATTREQANNRRRTTMIAFRGCTLALADMARKYGLTEQIVRWRVRAGWSLDDALTTPVIARQLRGRGPELRLSRRHPQLHLA